MRQVWLIIVLLAATGCGAINRGCSSITGDPTEVCWDGIIYLQFTSGSTTKVDADGKPVRCMKRVTK